MRTLAIATVLLASATTAFAAPASVEVRVGPALQAKAARELGVQDVNRLAGQLRGVVARRLAGARAYDGARIELVLVDVRANHPTSQQLHDYPWLSATHTQTGGVLIDGRAVGANGAVRPIRYLYTQSDFMSSGEGGMWADAQYGIEQFAGQLARGERLNTQPIKVFNPPSLGYRRGVVTQKYHG